MSQRLISRSPDLQRLRNEGYDVEIRGGHLLVKDVPYANRERQVRRGVLVSTLRVAGDVADRPDDHTVYFAGETPCHADGTPITQIINSSSRKELDRGLVVDHYFSSKPASGRYENFHDKMSTYAAILSSAAANIDPSATPMTFPLVEDATDDAVFTYLDTASTRAGIMLVNRKLELGRVAIIGLGGTGAYVLDQVAKTPVRQIRIYDGDRFSQHNAFRSPGAASKEELQEKPQKVVYLQRMYSKMHRGIVARDCYVDESNVGELRDTQFVFLCLDKGGPKRIIVEKLEEYGVPFVDVGMGLYVANEALHGVLRVTTSTPNAREHVRAKNRIAFTEEDGGNEYSTNIQVADLNALNAVLAVAKWKKLFGFYGDLEREHFCTYTLDGNALANEDHA
jgi:hypothetical protein